MKKLIQNIELIIYDHFPSNDEDFKEGVGSSYTMNELRESCKRKIVALMDKKFNEKLKEQKQKSELCKEALANILYWKDKANTTSGMLLSSHGEHSEECGRIMKNYEESFEKARTLLEK